MCVVCVSKGVEGVVAQSVDVEGAVSEDMWGVFFFV